MHRTPRLLVLTPLLLLGCSKEPTVALRVDCGNDNNQGTRVTINGEFKGECPLDMMLRDGELLVEARRDQEDLSYRYGKTQLQLAENSMKKISLDMANHYPEPYWYKSAKDIRGMQAYLLELPNGEHAEEISVKLERAYFDGATSIPGMHTYLEKNPNGKRRAEVEEKLQQAYCNGSGTIADMYSYLKKQANGKCSEEVKKNVNTLLKPTGFRDNFDGTVTQVSNGLQWMRCALGQKWDGSTCTGNADEYGWGSSLYKAREGTYAGKNDWRLPTYVELSNLVFCSSGQRDKFDWPEHGAYCLGSYQTPTIVADVFPNTPSTRFWSTYPGNPSNPWRVEFSNGRIWTANEYGGGSVRLVRAGQ